MPVIRMLGRVSGTRDGVDWPARGELLTVDQVEAEHLVAAGLAVLVDELGSAPVVESAAVELVVETAAKSTTARKRRSS